MIARKRLIAIGVKLGAACLALAATNGCTALVVGGAAAGGYVVAKDERPVGQMIDDGTITASIKSRLVADKYVSGFDINVDTYQGVVTLTGDVTSYVARDQALRIAGNINGVSSVVDNITVNGKAN